MRKLVVTENVTVDGVIDSSGGWFAPGDDTVDLAAVTAVLQEQSAASDALLLGRTSFEEMRAFWPQQTNDTTGIAAHLDQVQKFVVSSTMAEPGWENTTILRGSIVDEVTALKEQQGKDKRFVLACITPAGEKLIAKIFPEHARRITEIMSRLKPDEQIQLGDLCRKLGKGE